MTIGVDLRCLPKDGSPGAGVAHAARELVRALVSIVPSPKWNIYLPRGAAWPVSERENVSCIWLNDTEGSLLREALNDFPCDFLFVPSGAVAPGIRVPVVPWAHDIAIFEHPEWFPQSFLRRAITTRLYRRGMQRSKKILAVSEFTKMELVRTFALDPSIISVTHEGGDPILAGLSGETLIEAKQRARVRVAERGMTQPFILWLGTVEPRKNLVLLLDAWMRARTSFAQPTDLVIAGADGWRLGPVKMVLNSMRAYQGEGGSRLHRISSVSDEDRRDLLLAADIVVLPSWQEGFGLVALEALQAQTALVVSRDGGMKEVVGDAAVVLSPRNTQAWTQAFVSLMADEEARVDLARRGKSRSQGFTWERAAEITYRVLTSPMN
jgi:glycosyltransferase involved in cell wall biosynthesis